MKEKGNFILLINILLSLIVFGYFVVNILMMYGLLSFDEFIQKIILIIGGLVSFICLLLSYVIYTNKKFDEKINSINLKKTKEEVLVPNIEQNVIDEVIEKEVEEVEVEPVIIEEITEVLQQPIIESIDEETDLNSPDETSVEEKINIDLSKLKYEGKLMYTDLKVKEYYSVIKNHLSVYQGVTSRITNNKETFRKSGVLAQIRLVNNKLYVYLAIIPEPFISEGYKVKNVGDTKQYEETPTLIKITNEKSIKQFVDILDVMMIDKGINKKQRFKEINYIEYLYPNGEAILNGLGLSSEYLVNTVNSKFISKDLPENLLDYAPTIIGEPLSEEVYKTTIYLDSLCTYFNDGDIIDKDSLLAKKLIKKGDFVVIKGRGTLDKKFIIHADDFDSLAAKMIYSTNGTIVIIKH